MRELVKKYAVVYYRSPSYNLARVAMTFAVSWIYASTYYQIAVMPNPASLASVQNVLGVLYASTNFLGALVDALELWGEGSFVFRFCLDLLGCQRVTLPPLSKQQTLPL